MGSQSSHFPVEKGNIVEYPRIREFCRDKDIIHGYNMKYYPATAHVSKALGLSSVLTLTTYGFYYPQHVKGLKSPTTMLGSLHQLVSDAVCRRVIIDGADFLITLSSAQKNIYEGFGFPGEKIRVIPNFVDPFFLKKKPAAFNNRDRIVLYVGRLSSEKGVDTLLRAFALARPKDGSLRLVLVGEGPAEHGLQNLASELGVSDRVRFSGKLPYAETKRIYEKASIFVHPGLWPEPFGRTMLEAMASGMPVIASNTGSSLELLTDCGLLFEPGNVEQLVSRIQTLFEDTPLAVRLANDARARVESEYSEDRVIDKMVSLYQEVVRGASAAYVRIWPRGKPSALAESKLRKVRHVFGRLIDRTAVPVFQRMFDIYFGLFRRPDDLSRLQSPRVLFVMLIRGLGDAILCTPALNGMKKRAPECEITALTIPYVSGLVGRFRAVDRVLSLDIEHVRLSTFYRLIRRLRKLDFDVVIDISQDRSVLSAIFSLLSGARNLVGFSTGLRSIFFNHRHDGKIEGVHFADSITNMVGEFGLLADHRFGFETELTTEKEKESARRTVPAGQGPLFCVHPGSKGLKERRWAQENWACLLDALRERYGCRVVIIGSRNERPICKGITDRMKRPALNLAGRGSLGEAIAVMEQSDILLSSCSGPLHIAVALGLPAVYIGGGVDLRRWGAYGNSAIHRAVMKDSSCRPEDCHHCPQRWERCTGSIRPEVFLKVISDTMKELGRRSEESQ